MAQVTGNDSKSSQLNTDLNLVPFIDLLSTLVLFLLVTAVWLQVSVIPASSQAGESKTGTAESAIEFVRIQMEGTGIKVTWPVSTGLPEQTVGAENLGAALKEGYGRFPTLKAALAAKDELDYATVIAAIDSIRGAGFDNVGLSTD